jgi:hypothetical protein
MRGSTSSVGILSFFAAAIVVTASSVSASAGNTMPSSSHSMGDHMAYLIGSWKCDVALSAMMGNPATTDHGTLTFAMSPQQTIHSHVAAADYAQDAYYGYDAKTKTHWMSSADTGGVIVTETSKDGITFTGSSMAEGRSAPTRDTFTHPTATTIRDITELEQGGKWSKLADAQCTKM